MPQYKSDSAFLNHSHSFTIQVTMSLMWVQPWIYLQGWYTKAKSHNAFSRIKRSNAVWPPDPRASECETLTLSGSVWFTFHVLMACPLRHSTYLFAAYISMPSLAECHWEWRRGRGQSGANKWLKQLLLYTIHLHWPPQNTHAHTCFRSWPYKAITVEGKGKADAIVSLLFPQQKSADE